MKRKKERIEQPCVVANAWATSERMRDRVRRLKLVCSGLWNASLGQPGDRSSSIPDKITKPAQIESSLHLIKAYSRPSGWHMEECQVPT